MIKDAFVKLWDMILGLVGNVWKSGRESIVFMLFFDVLRPRYIQLPRSGGEKVSSLYYFDAFHGLI